MEGAIPCHSNIQQPELPLDIPAAAPVWRPIHYLGSKLRLVDSILAQVSGLSPLGATVCDLFAGSGTVSLALSHERNVIAADIQEYSRVLCSALLQPAIIDDAATASLWQSISARIGDLSTYIEPLLEYEDKAIRTAEQEPLLLCDLVEHGSLQSYHSAGEPLSKAITDTIARINKQGARFLATQYFGGVYFSYRQALFFDSTLDCIERMPAGDRDTYLSALLSTASTLVNSIGKQFAQPIRPRRTDGSVKRHLIRQMCRDRSLDASATFARWLARYKELPRGRAHRVIRDDYRTVLSELHGASLVYADPPYTRDHYSRFYHVLETFCLRDCPELSGASVRGQRQTSRGLYRRDRHQSPFCIRSKAPGAFADLCQGARKLNVPLLISYSPYVKNGHPRLVTVEEIATIAKAQYRTVDVVPAGGIAHSKLNKSELHLDTSPTAEVFIICRL